MMMYPSVTDLMRTKKVNDRYTLVIATAKRAREIVQTGITFTDCKSDKPVTIALHEIYENKVSFKTSDEAKKPEKVGAIMVGLDDAESMNAALEKTNEHTEADA